MNDQPYAARCVRCNTSFTEADIQGAWGCPRCGSRGVPCDPSMDVSITINTHELRILGIWAENYARRCDDDHLDDVKHESMKETVNAIMGRVESQLAALDKHTPLTMSAELKQLREAFPQSDITVYRDGKEDVD